MACVGDVTVSSTRPRSCRGLRAVRGAVTVDIDTPSCIDAAVHELLDQLIDANAIDPATS